MKTHLCLVAFLLLSLTPKAEAQWIQTSGPEGGYVSALAQDDSYFYAATVGPIFRLPKGDTVWTALPGLHSSLGAGGTSLFCDGSLLVTGTSGGGVFWSMDHGFSWQRFITGLNEGHTVWSLAARGEDLLAGTNCGVFRSTDGAMNWSPINTGQDSILVISLLPTDSTIFSGTLGGGVYRASDIGAPWTAANNGLPITTVWALTQFGGSLFAGGWWEDGVYRSTDYGTTWEPRDSGLTTMGVNALAVMGVNLIAGTFGGIYFSVDTGASWVPLFRQPSSPVMSLLVHSTDLYAGTTDGVFRTTDGGADWSFLHSGFIASGINTFYRDGTTLFAGANGLLRTTDDGASWVRTSLPAEVVHSLASYGQYLFAGTGHGVYRSPDRGVHWGEADPFGTMNAIKGVAVIPNGTSGACLFAATDSVGVYLSTDVGNSWTQRNSGLEDTVMSFLAVRDTFLFAGTRSGVFRTTLNGTEWVSANEGLAGTVVQCLTFKGDSLFAGTQANGIYMSSNNGLDWTAANNGLTDSWIGSLAVSGSNLFAGTGSGGVFLSEDGGASWKLHKTGLRELSIQAAIATSSDLFVGTGGAGVWRRPLAEMLTAVEHFDKDVPCVFSLEQNYPNPFNPTTEIVYRLPQPGTVTLTVHDMLGRVVKELVNENKDSGVHRALLDGSGLASGVYFYRLTAGTFHQTRKMLLVR
jgi:hypothetical protein